MSVEIVDPQGVAVRFDGNAFLLEEARIYRLHTPNAQGVWLGEQRLTEAVPGQYQVDLGHYVGGLVLRIETTDGRDVQHRLCVHPRAEKLPPDLWVRLLEELEEGLAGVSVGVMGPTHGAVDTNGVPAPLLVSALLPLVPALLAALQGAGYDIESTDAETIAELALDSPEGSIPRILQEYKHASQRKKVYGSRNKKRDGLTWWESYVTETEKGPYVYARFRQLGTDTGRFSSSDPNLQQIPVDGRKIIAAPPGYKIVQADYSGIEAWCAAVVFGDDVLLQALQSEDVHRSVASILFGVPFEQVTKKQRQLAKSTTFTYLFGGGWRRVVGNAKSAGQHFSEEEARGLIMKFNTRFKGVAEEREHAFYLSQQGLPATIVLPTGLKRVIIGDWIANQILNTKAQGTAAAGLKMALWELRERGMMKYVGAVVHDEIVACVPEREAEEYRIELERAMLDGMEGVLGVRVKVEGMVGDVWSK